MKASRSFRKPTTKMGVFQQGSGHVGSFRRGGPGGNKVHPLREGTDATSAAYAEKKQKLIKEYQEWRKQHLEELKEELLREQEVEERERRGESKKVGWGVSAWLSW